MDVVMTSLNALRDHGGMSWSERKHGWTGVPERILDALARDGFDECKRAVATSRRDSQSAGGVWQGLNPRTGSVASAIWVTDLAAPDATIFIQIDGASITRPER